MMHTPGGHGRLELSRFFMRSAIADHRPSNGLGYLRVIFAMDDIDELIRLAKNPQDFISIPKILWHRARSRSRKR
jgi:hypothetical protein